MYFSGALAIALVINLRGAFSCTDQCCELNCWEQCFTEGNSGIADDTAFYEEVYQVRLYFK